MLLTCDELLVVFLALIGWKVGFSTLVVVDMDVWSRSSSRLVLVRRVETSDDGRVKMLLASGD